jgi:hypothetical protein
MHDGADAETTRGLGEPTPNGATIMGLIKRATSCLIFGVCVLLSTCKGSETIWSAEARSPDGKMLASARTIAQSGFGTGYIGTTVYLNCAKGSPAEILGLSDLFEKPTDEISVEMKWITSTHLDLAYKGHRTVDFQVLKCGDANISVRDLSSAASGTSNSAP